VIIFQETRLKKQMFSIIAFLQQILFYLTNRPLNITEETVVPCRVEIMVISGIFKEQYLQWGIHYLYKGITIRTYMNFITNKN